MNINLNTYCSNIIFLGFWIFMFRDFWRNWWKLKPSASLFENNSMHSINRTVVVASRKEFFTLDSTCNNIAHQRIFLRQIGSKIHFLPFKTFSDAQSWKAKVRANGCTLDKVEQAV